MFEDSVASVAHDMVPNVARWEEGEKKSDRRAVRSGRRERSPIFAQLSLKVAIVHRHRT